MKMFSYSCLLIAVSVNTASAQFATQVVSYNPGSIASAGYTTPATALGSPERFTGELTPFGDEVTIFNPAFGTDEIVSIGEGGQITLKLSNYVLPDATGPEIGVFTNVGLVYGDFVNEIVGDPAATFDESIADVAVSADGITWVGFGPVNFNLPTQGYSDTAGTVPSNFQLPFTGVVSDFDGLTYNDPVNPDVFDLLSGSGGGTWLDISSLVIDKVGYIRFSVAPGAGMNFELDAVSISANALGGIVPEPSSLALVGMVLVCSLFRRR
jgi:hypothetical protein